MNTNVFTIINALSSNNSKQYSNIEVFRGVHYERSQINVFQNFKNKWITRLVILFEKTIYTINVCKIIARNCSPQTILATLMLCEEKKSCLLWTQQWFLVTQCCKNTKKILKSNLSNLLCKTENKTLQFYNNWQF